MRAGFCREVSLETMEQPRHVLEGTRPEGARSEQDAARRVREMFSRIAPRYDLLNHVLSLQMDRLWRRRVARRFHAILERADSRVLDLCCGTGDLTSALAQSARARVFGSDFAHPMLVRAIQKMPGSALEGRNAPPGNSRFAEADALNLPYGDGRFDLVTSAFGFRNLASYERGLREMFRILRPRGEVGILEFAEPRGGILGPIYRFYFRRVLPRLGAAISGDAAAYSYLPQSVARFPSPEDLADLMKSVGFSEVRYEIWTTGIVALHRGRR